MPDSGGLLASLDGKSPLLFLVGGGLLVVYAILHGMEAFLDIAFPMVRDGIIRPIGYIIGFVGVLGLYPALVNRSPKLARTGAIFTALGVVGWFVSGFIGSSRGLAAHLGMDPPAWLGVFGLLIALGFVIGLPAFGVATLRTRVFSRAVGIILLAPLVVMAANVAFVAGEFVDLAVGRFVVSAGDALIILALGIALRTERTPTRHPDPQPVDA